MFLIDVLEVVGKEYCVLFVVATTQVEKFLTR